MTRPTLAAPVVVSEFWKNRRGESIRVTLSTYQNCNVVDVRTYRSTQGKLRATAQGIVAEAKRLPQLARALTTACSRARELGLLGDDGSDQ